MSAFEKLAPFIREAIWRNGWEELRAVQVDAIQAIMDTGHHVLIASGTASGKTEAAFFPMLSVLGSALRDSFGILYIGPLKALINDQFQRISALLEQEDIAVYAWHGDRSAAEKRRAMRHPRGILQITPESLEGLLMHHPGDLLHMLQGLRFIVVDELHAFMGTDRGLQLQCQLVRLDRLLGRNVRRIAMSATLGSMEEACAFLSAGSRLDTVMVEGVQEHRKLALSLRHDTIPVHADETEMADREQQRMADLYDFVAGRNCLVFTPSRAKGEEVALALRQHAEQRGEPDRFHVHHGSISAALRAEAEAALREHETPAVAIATKTLELGIDLGTLERVVQLGTADSCSSFMQRLGRTGRRGQTAVMRFMTAAHAAEKPSFDGLPWELLHNLAVIRLGLEEHWVEPAGYKALPYSLLMHQTLSMLMHLGEATARELAKAVWTLPPFAQIPAVDYLLLLRSMLEADLIEKTEEGTLIPGLKGEKLANHYTFCSVFAETGGYRVICDQRELGEVDRMPAAGDKLRLAGRNWEVISGDQERRRVFVIPAKDGPASSWNGGTAAIHDRVVQRMHDILLENRMDAFLDHDAREALSAARRNAAELKLNGWYTVTGEHTLLLHPWFGTRRINTLYILLTTLLRETLHLSSVRMADKQMGIHVTTALDAEEFPARLLDALGGVTMEALTEALPPTPFDRYDPYVPEVLRKKAHAANQMDLSGLQDALCRGKNE